MSDYSLTDTAGFPFDKKTSSVVDGSSMVIPCSLESNVKKLHQFMYGNADAKLSDVVVSTSEDIEEISGLDEEDALDYGY